VENKKLMHKSYEEMFLISKVQGQLEFGWLQINLCGGIVGKLRMLVVYGHS
jgi:hypothetical protein